MVKKTVGDSLIILETNTEKMMHFAAPEQQFFMKEFRENLWLKKPVDDSLIILEKNTEKMTHFAAPEQQLLSM